MTLEGRRPVHPFFHKPTCLPSPDLQDESFPQSLPAEAADLEEERLPAKRGRKQRHGIARDNKTLGKRKSKDALLPVSQNKTILKSEPQGWTEKEGAEPKDFISIERNTIAASGQAHSSIDLNLGRRKRRKITPPMTGNGDDGQHVEIEETRGAPRPPSWHEQLQIEAEKSPQDAIPDPLDKVSNAMKAVNFATPESLSPAMNGIVSPVDEASIAINAHLESVPGQLPFKALHKSTSEATMTNAKHQDNNMASGAEQKPRKMLKLNARGRFSSPVASTIPEPPKDSTKLPTTKSRARRKRPGQCLAVMHYGSDNATRTSTGAKIESILAGVPYKGPSTRQASLDPLKATGPPKPTHPFFTGKKLQKEDDGPELANTDGKEAVDPQCPKPNRNRETAVTPGKLRMRAQAQHQEHDSFDGFGKTALASADPKMAKHPGMCDAPWPVDGTSHVRGLDSDTNACMPLISQEENSIRPVKPAGGRKLKGNVISVPSEEDILVVSSMQLDFARLWERSLEDQHQRHGDTPLLPERLLTTGVSIQNMVREQLHTRFRPSLDRNVHYGSDDETAATAKSQSLSALTNVDRGIKDSLTPFDLGQCETQDWVHKYAPKTAAEVLQSGKEVAILRDWLRSLTVMAVESGKDRPAASRTLGSKAVKKKRKRTEDLDDFIVSSDEDAADLEELTDPEDSGPSTSANLQKRSMVRSSNPFAQKGTGKTKTTNAVLLSGPHGCGKTAAVYAVAKELGFEVFEISPGSRRSGKDILDKVGSMTENHLVQHTGKDVSLATVHDDVSSQTSENVRKDIEDGKQGVMFSFFKPLAQKKTQQKAEKTAQPKAKLQKALLAEQQPRQQQKQSLILLEEVDILFEEDKQFWMTVFTLAATSKRPIIMTCNDENLVPLDALSLHAILRLAPPQMDMATDLLLLIAANEGHLLTRAAVSSLLRSRNWDLRASITDLNFWCQMAVGDQKGGLEWMYQRWPPGSDVDKQGDKLRVASKGTYRAGLGERGHNLASALDHVEFDKEEELLLEAWNNHKDQPDAAQSPGLEVLLRDTVAEASSSSDLDPLMSAELLADSLSAADMYSSVGRQSWLMDAVDATQPPLSDKARSSFTEGYPLQQADLVPDYTNLSDRLAVSSLLQAARATGRTVEANNSLTGPPSTVQNSTVSRSITTSPPTLTRRDFSAAFDPISEAPISALALTSAHNLLASSFDREFSIIPTDLAPYVRAIASSDMRVEARRLRLSNLLSAGGRGSKRLRTTRASRSALEGGKRQETRRERWFTKTLNLAMVMRTGGEWAGMGAEDQGTQKAGVEEGSVSNLESQDEL